MILASYGNLAADKLFPFSGEVYPPTVVILSRRKAQAKNLVFHD